MARGVGVILMAEGVRPTTLSEQNADLFFLQSKVFFLVTYSVKPEIEVINKEMNLPWTAFLFAIFPLA